MSEVTYCCKRFKDTVEEGVFIKVKNYDETEWIISELFHIYFCPFCGSHVKGEGFGDSDVNPNPEKRTKS